jgi:outer membrane lipoprotein-sorting protein
MNTRFPAILLLLLTAFTAGSGPAAEKPDPAARAKEILNKVDDMWRGKSSRAILSMKVKTANYTRAMSLEGWSKGKDMSLVRVIYPLKEKGTATLKTGSVIYTYLPKTDKTIRLTSGMMSGSWMGSHLTNDDLVKESRLTDDFTAVVTFEGKRDGAYAMDFSLTPKPDSPVVWGKITLTLHVEGDDYLPVAEVYYDEEMKPARTIVFRDIKTFGERRLPAVMKVTPADKPGEFTELVYESLDFEIPLDDSFFSISRLRRD